MNEDGAASQIHLLEDVPALLFDSWKWQFKNRIRSLQVLSRYVKYDSAELSALAHYTKDRLHVAITPYYLSLISDKEHPHLDPIGIQSCPDIIEYTFPDSGVEDPLGEDEQMPVNGIVHKYPDRCLFLCTNICSMYCRFCTRKREWADGDMPKSPAQLNAMLDYIKTHQEIRDVVLSGGDPISLPVKTLDYILSELRKIDHVEIIRIGTRFPVTLPQRFFDSDILDVLEKHAPIWVNTHFNHPVEVATEQVRRAIKNIQMSGCIVSNQCVLLKGVNDNADTMIRLSHALLKIGVRPYYMYLNDGTVGTKHLTTSVQCGIDIINHMRGFTSGLAIPDFVVDTTIGKISVSPSGMRGTEDGHLILTNYEGRNISIVDTAD